MLTLYHFPLCPYSRKVRIVLREKACEVDLLAENFWQRRPEFLQLNPAGEVPILIDELNNIFTSSNAICEYLEETTPDKPLLATQPLERAKIRKICAWFDHKFYNEVTQYLLGERVYKFYQENGEPHSAAIIAGHSNIHHHLEYIKYLTKLHRWLAGDDFTLADICAAAQLSVLDYLGDIPWKHHPEAREWYALVKSRPSVRPLLSDRIMGFAPSPHYANPDF